MSAAIEALSLTALPLSGSLSSAQLRLVKDYVQDRIDDRIELSDLAAVVGLSRFHFSRAFKRSTGRSPYQYVVDRRVEKATDLLRTSNQSLDMVARSAGFSTPTQMRRAFIDRLGISPHAVRREGGRSTFDAR